MLNNNEPIKVFYDGQVFRPELPLDLPPNTHYEISLQNVVALNVVEAVSNLALSDLYGYVEPTKVEAFLSENGFLEEFLLSAYPTIQSYFPNAKFTLEVVPTSNDIKLLVRIYVEGKQYQLLTQFNELKSKWWFGVSKALQGKVSISIEHPNFSSENAWGDFEKFIGKIEIPANNLIPIISEPYQMLVNE